jgi:transposase
MQPDTILLEKESGQIIGKGLRKKVALLHEYVANCRKDWHRKLSHQICDDAGMVFLEDLNLVGLSRAILAHLPHPQLAHTRIEWAKVNHPR